MRRTGGVHHRGDVRKIFVVERYLGGWTAEEIDDLERRSQDSNSEFTNRGVRHIESIVIPADETCLSVFEGPDADTVRHANEACQLPTGRVLLAVVHPADHHPDHLPDHLPD
jgi:hypothetical protein